MVTELWPNKSTKEIVALLDKVGKKLQDGPAADSNKEMFDQCNCFEFLMDLKQEAISSKGLWTAKKRYALLVHNSEGVDYAEPKLKIKGLDLVKTSTPKAIRDKLKDMLRLIFEHDEEHFQKAVAEMKEKFNKMPVEDIAFPRSVNDLDKWIDPKIGYKKGTPIAVRAAIIFNKLNKDGKYPTIKNGDKVKFIYLKTPNKLRENIVGWFSHGSLPEEFGLHNIIDRELQWEKVVISPLKGLTEAINWDIEPQATLEGVLF
jgi:DNA polymerase elongation subunit (family B)